MATTQKNEGEGSRTAAKAYNRATTQFAKSGKVAPAAQKAKAALKSKSEAAEMERAEAVGRRPAKSNASRTTKTKSR